MKSKYKIIISISVILLLSVCSLIVYFVYAKQQEKEYKHIICYSYNKNCCLDFGYVKNAKYKHYSFGLDCRYVKIQVPDVQLFINHNVKTHENYKGSRLDSEGNEEIFLAKDEYTFCLKYSKSNSNSVIVYDTFGYWSGHLFPFIMSNRLYGWNIHNIDIEGNAITYEELNISVYDKKYQEDIFVDYESIKQFYVDNYSSNLYIFNDELKTIRLKVAEWYQYNGWSKNYPIEIQCRENDIFVHAIEGVIWEDIEDY